MPTANGKSKRRSKVIELAHSDKRGAKRALTAWLAELDGEPERLAIDAEAGTVAELLDDWITVKSPTWSAKHNDTVRTQCRSKIIPRIGDKPAASLTGGDIDAMYADLLRSGARDGGPLSPTSVRSVHRILSAAFASADRKGRLVTNPVAAATPPKPTPTHVNPPPPEMLREALDLRVGQPESVSVNAQSREEFIARGIDIIGYEPSESSNHQISDARRCSSSGAIVRAWGSASPLVQTSTFRDLRIAVNPSLEETSGRALEHFLRAH